MYVCKGVRVNVRVCMLALAGQTVGRNQDCNARKVNCSCVYSAYILKPVLSGRN